MEKETNKVLEDIKKLMVLALISQGTQAKDVAKVLGVDAAIISRMVPSRKIKKSN